MRGEAIAKAYVSKHCCIRHCNWVSSRKEIDIVAEKNGCIYFIEVKTRASNRFGWPEAAVDHRKQDHIQAVAADYLEYFQLYPSAIRFDIIAITFQDDGSYELMHFKDVF
ncbi:MAG TPA: YraN family protein [Chitinophaga sp.]|uniref:YraN family protein n=1 Tax=Chitinophaga sp. TaxID=1869181 RepID=UPI002B5D4BC7|nr:YraN family protein [Chitinophaga sp.]HVI46172.1 YraN family protein [Chitinophaga sp.]